MERDKCQKAGRHLTSMYIKLEFWGRIIEPILQLFIWVCWSGALPQKLALSVLSGESQAQHEMLSPLQIKKKKKKLQSSICYFW